MSLKLRFLFFFVLPFLALVQCSQTSQEEIVSIPDQGFLKAFVDLGVNKATGCESQSQLEVSGLFGRCGHEQYLHLPRFIHESGPGDPDLFGKQAHSPGPLPKPGPPGS